MPTSHHDTAIHAAGILDLGVLKALFAGDRQMQTAVLEEFRRCADPYAEELAVAIAAQDRQAVHALAHTLKSSSRTIGAAALGDQCEVLEREAEAAPWNQLQALELRIQLLLAKVIDAIIDADRGE